MKIEHMVVVAFVSLLTTGVTHAAEEKNIGNEVGQSLSDMKKMYGKDGVIDDLGKNDGKNLDKIIDPPRKEANPASKDNTKSKN